MFKHYFELIKGVEIYPILSLAIFLLFFSGVLIWIFKADKSYLTEMENLPLDEDK